MDQESLLPFDTPLNNNNKLNFNNEDNSNENTLIFEESAGSTYPKIICFFICIVGFVALIEIKIDSNITFLIGAFILGSIIWYIIAFIFIVHKIQFTKNTYLNQLIVKQTNLCCCSKTYTLMLENIYIFCQKSSKNTIKIIIINTLKNPREIDLDKSNIKTSPITIKIELDETPLIKGDYNELQLKFDNFLRQQKYENYIYDEINKYINLYNKNYQNDNKDLIDKFYMKITEQFYTFFLQNKNNRTDFIYSNDFERLFIGEVNGSKYKNTLLINLSEIDTFEIFEEKITDPEIPNNYYLVINYKNHQKSQIYMGSRQIPLEKFILLLNGKLNDINEMKRNNNNYNYTPQY